MNSEWNNTLSSNSQLSERKSTIGTSSLSSQLTTISFTDITVSSQESFDNDIGLPKKKHPKKIRKPHSIVEHRKKFRAPEMDLVKLQKQQLRSYQKRTAECFIANYPKLTLLKCASRMIAEHCRLQSICPILEIEIEQQSARSFPTTIVISPMSVVNLAKLRNPLSTVNEEAHMPQEELVDERTQSDSVDGDCTSVENHFDEPESLEKEKNSRKTVQKYRETSSKKVFQFNCFPETDGNRSCKDKCISGIDSWIGYTRPRNTIESFDDMIGSIEDDIGIIESICLLQESNTKKNVLSIKKNALTNGTKSHTMDTKEMLNETLQILNDLIIDVYRNSRKIEDAKRSAISNVQTNSCD